MVEMNITPIGIDTPICESCGEWIGASAGLIDSVRRHSICFNTLVAIQEIASSENPDVGEILALTIKMIGDKRE